MIFVITPHVQLSPLQPVQQTSSVTRSGRHVRFPGNLSFIPIHEGGLCNVVIFVVTNTISIIIGSVRQQHMLNFVARIK